MTIEKRLTKLEEQTAEPNPQGAFTDWWGKAVNAVYSATNEADHQRRLTALGKPPEPVMTGEHAFCQRLAAVYGQ